MTSTQTIARATATVIAQPLPINQCDQSGCTAAAKLRVEFKAGGSLQFCAHHGNGNAPALKVKYPELRIPKL